MELRNSATASLCSLERVVRRDGPTVQTTQAEVEQQGDDKATHRPAQRAPTKYRPNGRIDGSEQRLRQPSDDRTSRQTSQNTTLQEKGAQSRSRPTAADAHEHGGRKDAQAEQAGTEHASYQADSKPDADEHQRHDQEDERNQEHRSKLTQNSTRVTPNESKLSDGGWRCQGWNSEKAPSPASVRWSAWLGLGVTSEQTENRCGGFSRSQEKRLLARMDGIDNHTDESELAADAALATLAQGGEDATADCRTVVLCVWPTDLAGKVERVLAGVGKLNLGGLSTRTERLVETVSDGHHATQVVVTADALCKQVGAHGEVAGGPNDPSSAAGRAESNAGNRGSPAALPVRWSAVLGQLDRCYERKRTNPRSE